MIPFLGEVCDEDGTFKEAALAVDTDNAGFFQEADFDSLKFFSPEFETRIKLELLLFALIAPHKATP